MNLTALIRLLTVYILTALSLSTDANAQKEIKQVATFPGGIVYLPTVNENSVIVRYTTPFVKEATFYPRGDTLMAMRLDTCQRSYIALSWAFDALEQRHIDSLVSNKTKQEQMVKDNAKEVKKVKRKSGLRGFLWGGVVGIIGGIVAFTR